MSVTASMSPAPYPPLLAGDDLDADFFDQLGEDELDLPAQEASVPQKHQDAGLVNLRDLPGAGLVSSGPGAWSSGTPKVHPEEVEFHPLQEGNSHVHEAELDDAFTNLRLETQDTQPILQGVNDVHLLSNGDDVGDQHSAVGGDHDLEHRVNGDESSIFDSFVSTAHPVDYNTVAQFGGSEDSATDAAGGSGSVQPESKLSGEMSFSAHLAAETAAVIEEVQSSLSSQDLGEVKPPDPSKAHAQITRVEEVQWSNFGAELGLGSFSDLLSVYPASSSASDFFHVSEQSTLDVRPKLLAPAYDDVSFFDSQHPQKQGGARAAEVPLPTLGAEYGTQASVHLQGVEQQGQGVQYDPNQWNLQPQGVEQHGQRVQYDSNQYNLQPQGEEHAMQSNLLDYSKWNSSQAEWQGQQTPYSQSDQGVWQELAEYPGWLHNTLTGEWVAKESSDTAVGTATSWDYASGQDRSQGGGGNETIQWNGHDATANATNENDLQEDPHMHQPTAGTSSNEWTRDQGNVGETNATDGPLLVETVEQQNAAGWSETSGEVASGVWQSGWEDQYPGWEYDYQTQHWKQKQDSQLPRVAEEEPESTSTSGSVITHSNTQGYNGEWYEQQQNLGGSYVQDIHDSHNSLPGFTQTSLRTYSDVSSQAQATGQWIGMQPRQFDNPPSYFQPGQPLSKGANQQYWNGSYTVPQVGQVGHQQLGNQYNPHPASQMPPYAPQPQSWQPVNSYPTSVNPYSQHVAQTAPRSVEEALRTSAGRPPHVLMGFGFGGKLVHMKLKDPVSLQSSDGHQSFASGQAFVPGPIQIQSMSLLVAQSSDNRRRETGSTYFGALNRSNLSGPLVGGSVSSKELTKWLDDQAANCLSSGDSLAMLWGLLKLACKHYGKLRSQVGSAGIASQEQDGAEAALAKLLTSVGDQSLWTMGSFRSTVCLQPMPSEHELQLTASETKKLLVAGKRKEALKTAQQGQLWGPALVLAHQLGEKYYADTVAEMAQRQFLPGSPLRTLSLLLAGQPAEVFSEKNVEAVPGTQPMQIPSSSGNATDGGLGSMLEDWKENLSIMASNRTNGDDRVISHLGDCIWKVKGEVAAAHICYLVADSSFEAFSNTARLCLVGADHWKNPRTYATPEAIQRTEVYEYAKFLGNPQFILAPFQPYKLVYASMLAEAGKTAEALRYCQAVLKTLKTSSRTAEVEACREAAASLEERLRIHLQGSPRIAPSIFNGWASTKKILDGVIGGMIGGPPPPIGQEQVQMAPSAPAVTLQDHLIVPPCGASPSRALPPLAPSVSAERLKESGWSMPQRSVSEPDFSTSMKEKADQVKPMPRGGYLGRFGSVFSKAGGIVSMVSKTSKKEAKLGDKNKFYYDEKLKRWVEEGAEVSQEEAVLAPPPTSANFVSKVDDASSPDSQTGAGFGATPSPASKSAYLGTPPVPPSNQFSSRSRQQGVRSRYVDTFNKGNNSTTPSKPSVSAFAPVSTFGGAPFFVPGPDNMNDPISKSENGTSLGSSVENHVDYRSESGSNVQEHQNSSYQLVVSYQNRIAGPGIPMASSFDNVSAFGTSAMYRVPSSDNTTIFGAGESVQRSGKSGRMPSGGDIGFSNGYHSRANSWSGYPSNFQTPQKETKSSYDKPTTNYSNYNGFSGQNAMNPLPAVGSYFPSPAKVDSYHPHASTGLNDTYASPPPSVPSVSSFMPVMMGSELRPRAMEVRGGSNSDVFAVGDDLQEVEL